MLINYKPLIRQITDINFSLCFILGDDEYLLNEAAVKIKKLWQKTKNSETSVVDVNSPDDFAEVFAKANSYSLFADSELIDVQLKSKKFDKEVKQKIVKYLDNPNKNSLVLIRAHSLKAKQIDTLKNHPNALIIQVYPLKKDEFKAWVKLYLQKLKVNYKPDVIDTIFNLTEGNLFAAAQALKQLSLVADDEQLIDANYINAILTESTQISIYELSDACAEGSTQRALAILKQLKNSQTEPPIVLWLLSQDINNLLELAYAKSKEIGIKNLNLWPKKIKQYELMLKKHNKSTLTDLLKLSQQTDQCIKINKNNQTWELLEQITCKLSQP